MPEVASLAELNDYLSSGCAAFADQIHYKKSATIAELLQQDQQALKACPSVRFNPVRFEVRRTDKTGVVTVGGNRYLVGPAWAGRQVTVELSHDTVTVLDDNARRIVALPRVFGTTEATVINPLSVLPLSSPEFCRGSYCCRLGRLGVRGGVFLMGLAGWAVPQRRVHTTVVVPADPYRRRDENISQPRPGPSVDEFSFEYGVQRFCHRVVVGVSPRANRGDNLRLSQGLSVDNRPVLHAPV
nr:hypothetical protein [Corynebacterium auris]